MNVNEQYYNLLKKVYKTGFEYEDPNRRGIKRLQIPHYTFEHNFREDGFPAIGLKQTYPKLAFQELKAFLLGIKSIKGLNKMGINFWNKDGYNFYKNRSYEGGLTLTEYINLCNNVEEDEILSGKEGDIFRIGDLGRIYPYQMRKWNGCINQILNVLDEIKKNPYGTKRTITMWNPSDFHYMALSACHWSFELISTEWKRGIPGLIIKFHIHSSDLFLGFPINLMYYSFLCYILSHYLGFHPIGVVGDLSNIHLYDNSFKAVETILEKDWSDLNIPHINISADRDNNFDSYISSLEWNDTIKVKNYSHLGNYNVEMLPYNK